MCWWGYGWLQRMVGKRVNIFWIILINKIIKEMKVERKNKKHLIKFILYADPILFIWKRNGEWEGRDIQRQNIRKSKYTGRRQVGILGENVDFGRKDEVVSNFSPKSCHISNFCQINWTLSKHI